MAVLARKKPVALVVDDEASICWAFERLLKDEGCEVHTASTAEDGLAIANRVKPSVVLLDVRLPKADGLTMLPRYLEITNRAPTIVMTAFGDLETAVTAVKNGAMDYLVKPFKLEDAVRACRSALQAAASEIPPQTISLTRTSQEGLIGRTPAIQQAFRQIALVADSDIAVLITGEQGTGKELVAAAIHRHSKREQQAFLSVSPSASTSAQFDVDFFGAVRGGLDALTEDKSGLLERATDGTIFIDEISALSIESQVRLLRLLERRQFSRLGDVESRTSNVRVLAATSRDLHELVKQGLFREDLLYHLNGVHIHLPPLRERTEDIPILAEYFLERIEYPHPNAAISAELMQSLVRRKWYGNIRELKNTIEHAAVTARGRPFVESDFGSNFAERVDAATATQTELEKAVADWVRNSLDDVHDDQAHLHEFFLRATEPTLFRLLLQHTGGNKAKAADLLGLHRGTLRERLRTYGISS